MIPTGPISPKTTLKVIAAVIIILLLVKVFNVRVKIKKIPTQRQIQPQTVGQLAEMGKFLVESRTEQLQTEKRTEQLQTEKRTEQLQTQLARLRQDLNDLRNRLVQLEQIRPKEVEYRPRRQQKLLVASS